MILAAKKCEVDIVKFQKRDIETLYSKEYLSSSRRPLGKTQYDQKKGLEFGYKEYDIIDKFCKKLKFIGLRLHGIFQCTIFKKI